MYQTIRNVFCLIGGWSIGYGICDGPNVLILCGVALITTACMIQRNPPSGGDNL